MTEHKGQREFLQGLATLRADVAAAGLPEGSEARLDERLTGARRQKWRPSRLAWALAAVSVSSMALLVGRLAMPPEAAGFVLTEASPSFQWSRLPERGLEVLDGHGILEATEIRTTVKVERGTRIHRNESEIYLFRGRATFNVRPRTAGEEPVAIEVSHGRIGVVGTEFTVVQNESGGSVSLHRGRLQFVSRDGDRHFIEAGETFAWPLAVETSRATETRENVPTKSLPTESRPPEEGHRRRVPVPPAAHPPLDISAVLAKIDHLRIRGDHARLVETIDSVIGDLDNRGLQESLSFERCDVLAHRLRRPRRACAELAEHLERFPAGRYTGLVREAQERLSCPVADE